MWGANGTEGVAVAASRFRERSTRRLGAAWGGQLFAERSTRATHGLPATRAAAWGPVKAAVSGCAETGVRAPPQTYFTRTFRATVSIVILQLPFAAAVTFTFSVQVPFGVPFPAV